MRVRSIGAILLMLATISSRLSRVEAVDWQVHDLPIKVDPDGDCKCVVRKGAAEISVPGTPHDLSAELGHMSAPRALCELEGDFSVRVKNDFTPSPRTRTLDQRKAYQGASLVLMVDDANYVRLDHGALYEETDNMIHLFANFELRSNFDLDGISPTAPSRNNSFGVSEKYLRYLRLDRVGEKVAGYVSSDGVKWLYLGRKRLKLPDKVKVGVAAVNTAKEPLNIRLSEFGTAQLAAASKPLTVIPLTKEQLEKLLAIRTHGSIREGFAHMSSLFLISTRMELPYGVAITTSSPAIVKNVFQPVFPNFYTPTLREYLDAVALQSSSEWKYDPTGKFYKSEVDNGPAEDLAMFEFIETKQPELFKIELANGWKSQRRGDRTVLFPPDESARLEIVDHGSYSPRDGQDEKELLKKVVTEFSLETARRLSPDVEAKDLSEAKVGTYSAKFFETLKTLSDGSEWRWRKWSFSADNRCFVATAVMREQSKERIGGDIETMLKSFQMTEAPARGNRKNSSYRLKLCRTSARAGPSISTSSQFLISRHRRFSRRRSPLPDRVGSPCCTSPVSARRTW
jgi:hypothetical protein